MLVILLLVLIFVLPVALIQLGILPVKYRLWFLTLLTLVALGIIRFEGWSAFELGLRTDNFVTALLPHTLFTLAGIAVIAFYAKTLGRKIESGWHKHPHFLGLFVPISIFQVLLYRSYLIPTLQDIFTNPVLVIAGHAVIFTYLHFIYPNPKTNLPIALLGGVGFATMYLYYPNFYLAALSHMALNFAAVYYGFFRLTKSQHDKIVKYRTIHSACW